MLSYDIVICGAGSAGSALAGRQAAVRGLSVLLIEAGGSDEVPQVMTPEQWFLNLDSERDWRFRAEPGAGVAGRALPLTMGKVPGGGCATRPWPDLAPLTARRDRSVSRGRGAVANIL